MIACLGGTDEGHDFCAHIGCDYCIMVVSSPPTTRYECDGLRRVGGGASLIGVGKWNGSIAAAREYSEGLKYDG